MLGRVAIRRTHACTLDTQLHVSQSVTRLRPMSTKRLQDAVKYLEATDLIDTGRIRHPHLDPEAFSEKLREREPDLEASTAPEETREEIVSNQRRYRTRFRESKERSAEARQQWIEQTPANARELREVAAAQEEAFLSDAAIGNRRRAEHVRIPKDMEGGDKVMETRPRKFRTPKPTERKTEDLSDPIALAASAKSANLAAQRGGRRRTRRRGVNLFGEEEGKEEDDKRSIQGEEDATDLDPDAVRLMRQMSAWRNPVIAEEAGQPALFRSIKTGYDLYAEARTEFRLDDHTASVTVNSPTAPLANTMGGDYSLFLNEHTKGLAGQDSSSRSPADIVRLALVQSAGLSPMHKEALAITVQEFIANATTSKARAAP